MTRDEFKTIVKGLKTLYNDPKYIADHDAFELWFSLLGDLDYNVASMATQAYMQTEIFPPKPADIRRYAQQITSPKTESMTEIEAWGLVRKAISNGTYGYNEEFKKLPKIIQETLGSPIRIYEMAQVNIAESETVLASNFMRNYRARLESHKHDMQMNEGLRSSIDQMREDAMPEIEVKHEEVKQIETQSEEVNGLTESVQTALDELLGRTQKCG